VYVHQNMYAHKERQDGARACVGREDMDVHIMQKDIEHIHYTQHYTHKRVYQITCPFCRISSLSLGSFAKETCHFKENMYAHTERQDRESVCWS